MKKIFDRLKDMCDLHTASDKEIDNIINLLIEEYKVHESVGELVKEQVLEQVKKYKSESNVTYGVEIGNTCPICKIGNVMDFGGCHSCSNCGAQLKCGL